MLSTTGFASAVVSRPFQHWQSQWHTVLLDSTENEILTPFPQVHASPIPRWRDCLFDIRRMSKEVEKIDLDSNRRKFYLRGHRIYPRGWVCIRGLGEEANFLRTAKLVAARMEAGGSLRTYQYARPAEQALQRSGRASNRSRKRHSVLCPPGTRLFRELFLRLLTFPPSRLHTFTLPPSFPHSLTNPPFPC